MKILFVTVGTSLLQKSHLGLGKLTTPLRSPQALAAWSAERNNSITAAPEAIWHLLDRLAAGTSVETIEALGRPSCHREEWIGVLRAAFADERLAESDWEALPAELASLAALLPEYPLASGDRVVLIASDSLEGAMIGLLLQAVLAGHPRMGGATVEVVWPDGWQPHDGTALFGGGAIHLLQKVDEYLGKFAAACPLFILTGGLKLAIAVLLQVSCWAGRLEQQDGILFKLENLGTLYFPPCRFFRRGREEVLLPRAPSSGQLLGHAPFTQELRQRIEPAAQPSRFRNFWKRRPTTLLATAGLGVLDKSRLSQYFGETSRLSNNTIWSSAHEHWNGTWSEVRAIHGDAPREDELRDAEPAIRDRLASFWMAGDTRSLPAELASLRAIWSGDPKRPLLKGPIRIVLLATDTLLGKTSAALVERFLHDLLPDFEILMKEVPGLHPYRSASRGEDRFSSLTEIAIDEGRKARRVLFLPLGGPKIHLPIMTVLASRLRAPMMLGHRDLGQPFLVPWLESENGKLRSADIERDWPEFSGVPRLLLENR